MNEIEIKGSWNQLKGLIKQQYSQITDDDLKYTEGKFDEIIGKLQVKTGKTKEELKNEIRRLQATLI